MPSALRIIKGGTEMKRFVSVLLALCTLCMFAGVVNAGVAVTPPGTLPIVEEPATLDVFISLLPWVSDIVDNDYTRELEEKTNIHLNMTVVPDDSYKEKLNLVLNSGEYPEVIMSGGFDNAALMQYGASEGILIPLNDLIDEYAPNMQAIWEERPYIKEAMTAPDGNIYGFPWISDGAGNGAVSYKFWVNTTWLDTLGLEMPQNTEEFKQMLIAFRDNDPNGNGIKDEVPMSGAINTWAADPYLFLLNSFDYFSDTLLKLKDGVMSDTCTSEGFRNGLIYIADLYSEGLIDPAAFTQNLDQLLKLGANPDAVILGSMSCGHVGMAIDVNNYELSKSYSVLTPLEGPDGYRGIPYFDQASISGAQYVITDVCQNPEMATRLADLLNSEEEYLRYEHGIQGVQWDYADEGTYGYDGVTPAVYKNLTQNAQLNSALNFRWSGTSIHTTPMGWTKLWQVSGDIYDPLNYDARLFMEQDKLEPYRADVDQIPAFYVDADTSARITQLSTPLTDYVKSSIVEFITGLRDASNDADWQNYLDGLERLELSEFVAANQAAYDMMQQS